MRRWMIALVCTVLAVPAVRAQSPEEISRRINARDCAGLVPLLTRQAEAKQPVAERQLATIYYNGCGVAPDLPQAVRLYTDAAEQGDALAQLNLGRHYALGTGADRDPLVAAG